MIRTCRHLCWLCAALARGLVRQRRQAGGGGGPGWGSPTQMAAGCCCGSARASGGHACAGGAAAGGTGAGAAAVLRWVWARVFCTACCCHGQPCLLQLYEVLISHGLCHNLNLNAIIHYADLAASLLVGQPGALPRLLRHATSGKAHPNFTAALASRASRGFPQPTGAAAAAPSTSAGAASSRGPAAGEGTGSAVPGMGPGQQLVPCPPAFLADMDDMMGMFLGCLRLDDEQLQGELWNKFEGWAGAAGALSAPSAAPLPPLTSAPAGPTGSSGNGRIVWPNGAAATGGARLGTTEALMAARDRGQPGTSGLGSSALAGSVSSSGGPAGAVPRSGLAVGPGGLELSAQQLAAGFLASLAEADGDNAARLLVGGLHGQATSWNIRVLQIACCLRQCPVAACMHRLPVP